MRITDNMQLNDALASQASASSQMYGLTAEASSGLKMTSPSDDPAGYATVSSLNAPVSRPSGSKLGGHGRRGRPEPGQRRRRRPPPCSFRRSKSRSRRRTAVRVRRRAANSATQVNQIAQQMIGLANTQGANGYLFGGTNTSTPPFDANGNFSGNAGVTQVEIANGVTVQERRERRGRLHRGRGPDVIADLQNLATALSRQRCRDDSVVRRQSDGRQQPSR